MDEEVKPQETPPSEEAAEFPERELPESADFEQAKRIINELVNKGIKVLALDFDKTIVDIHTAGFWRQGTQKLADRVRPCFEALIRAALPTQLHVCVVTYSMQPNLIRDVLRAVMPRRYDHLGTIMFLLPIGLFKIFNYSPLLPVGWA